MIKRAMKLQIGGEDYEVPVNWKVTFALAEAGYDPVDVAVDLHNQEHLTAKGIRYTPRYPLNVKTVVNFLHVAIEASGYKVTRDEIGEMIVQEGIGVYMEKVPEYIALVMANGPEEVEAIQGNAASVKGGIG